MAWPCYGLRIWWKRLGFADRLLLIRQSAICFDADRDTLLAEGQGSDFQAEVLRRIGLPKHQPCA